MIRIAVLVSGGGTNLQALIDAKARGEIPHGQLALVLSSKPGVYALQRAADAGIPAVALARKSYDTADAYDGALLQTLQIHAIDVVVLAGFLTIIGPKMLAAYPRKIINVHPSLIPAFCGDGYYGLRVHQAALARGVTLTGATVHLVNEITDGGEILMQKAVPVQAGDTPQSLQKRVMEQAEWLLLPKATEQVCAALAANEM